ncbi:MAG: ATP-dependent Clp protease proteolytic subunit [Candidatus Buchananbacteria bacterium]
MPDFLDQKEPANDWLFLKHRQINLDGEVNSTMLSQLRKRLISLTLISQEEIVVNLNTRGGGTKAGFGIYDLISHFAKQAKVTIRVMEACNSMGVVILMAGSVRQATPNATFKVHNTLITLSRDYTKFLEVAKAEVASAEVTQNRMLDILAQHSKNSFQDWQDFCQEEKEFSAEEALAVGLIDEII